MLVVDDEPSLGNALRRLLAIDHEVTVVQSGVAAFDVLRASPTFDVVLCDVMMPELCGPDLYELVHAESAPPTSVERFIFMTGGIFTPRVRAFLGSIPNPVIEKPFSLSAMRSMLVDFVEACERRR